MKIVIQVNLSLRADSCCVILAEEPSPVLRGRLRHLRR